MMLTNTHCSDPKCTDPHETNTNPSIFEIVKSGHLVNLQTFTEREGPTCLETRDPEGHTALHWACYRGHQHQVRHLLSVDVNSSAVNLSTESPPRQKPIHWACVNGSIEIVDMLLSAGVPIDQTDDKGCTPLIVAAQYGKSALTAFLIGRGAQRQLVDVDGDTCLHWAAFKGHNELMRLLIYSGLSPHQKDRYGQSPVHLACINGCLTAVKELYEEEHVDIKSPDQNGKTPLSLAMGRKHTNVVLYLQGALQSRSNFFSSLDFKSLVFGPPGKGKTAYWFLVLNFLLWAYPMYVIKCLPQTWYDLQYLHIIFIVVNISMWISMYQSKNSNPGFLAKNTESYHHTVKQIALAAADMNTVERTLASLCHTCRLVKRPRSKHCRVCNRCVANFDHHCPYIYNCVGYDNRVWFIVFVTCVTVAMEITVYFAYYTLAHFGRDYLVVAGLVEAAFFTVIAILIFAATWYHAFTNLTTNEHVNLARYDYLKDASGRYNNRYARHGPLHNLLEFLHLRRGDEAYSADELQPMGIKVV